MKKLVSIIIVNFNQNDYNPVIIDCLKTLTTQTYTNFEVIIADNGSDYELFLQLKKDLTQFEGEIRIQLIRIEQNLFFAGGNNKAIKNSAGDYVCLLNSDTEVNPNFIESMVNFLEEYPDAGFICPKIKAHKNKDILWYAGANIDLRNKKLIKIRGQWERDPLNLRYNKISETDFAAGTAVFVRRKVLAKIGLMDEIFFMYHEDPDWNIRAQRKGYRSFYVPTTFVYHKVSRQRKKKWALLNSYFVHRNLQILIWKHAKFSSLLIFYIIFFITNVIDLIAYLILSISPDFVYNYFYHQLNLPYKNKKHYNYAGYLRLKSLIQGFIIGFKRRIGRSCKKDLLKDYHFIIKHQKIINKL
ncbi:MAG: glycosyltransferase family 2 protein [Promethearchaeota archaeon]